jgi:hypothetical protein
MWRRLLVHVVIVCSHSMRGGRLDTVRSDYSRWWMTFALTICSGGRLAERVHVCYRGCAGLIAAGNPECPDA